MTAPLDDSTLSRLIRLAGQTRSAADGGVSDEDVQRYLLGTADAAAVERVRAELESSSEFRRFIRDATADLDSVIRASEATSGIDARQSSSWHWAIVIPLVAAALLIVSVLPWKTTDKSHPWQLYSSEIEVERLLPLAPRSAQPLRGPHASHESAAMARLRENLSWSGSELTLSPGPEERPPAKDGETYRLRVSLNAGDVLGEWETTVPGDDVRVWMLTLPTRDLYSVTARTGVMNTILYDRLPSAVCVLWTYHIGGEFMASRAFQFRRSERE